ncbi:MAG: hypothetical protein HQ456_01900 [Polynucleobacter sp.]|nr:hypothetical protein [Polynucleobacter sp.]
MAQPAIPFVLMSVAGTQPRAAVRSASSLNLLKDRCIHLKIKMIYPTYLLGDKHAKNKQTRARDS